MRHKEYNDYFRAIATNHREILHEPKAKFLNFFKITLTEDLFPTDYLANLIEGMKTKITGERPFLVLESYSKDNEDKQKSSPKSVANAAFYILHKPLKDNHDDQELKIDQCEEIAEDIIAWMQETFSETCGDLMLSDTHIQTIANAGSGPFFGVKCHFRFQTTSESLTYRAARWVAPV